MVRVKDIESEIYGYLAALNQTGFPITKVYLFGSMAKGEAHEYSDIDLAVWSPAFGSNYFENIEKTAPLKRIFKRIELHPFQITETSEDNPFIEEIEKTGRKIG